MKIKEEKASLTRCCRVQMIRYSIFEGLTDRRLVVSQVYTESSIQDRVVRLLMESVLENEM